MWSYVPFLSSMATCVLSVSVGNKYSMGCDVYSFGIAVWEMIARKRPIIGHANNVDLAIIYATATGKC